MVTGFLGAVLSVIPPSGRQPACTFHLRRAPCVGLSLTAGCWNSSLWMLLMGRRSLALIFFSFFSSPEVQVLSWGRVTMAGVPTGALAWPGLHQPHRLTGARDEFSCSNDMAVNYHLNVFCLFHCALYTPAAVILKTK